MYQTLKYIISLIIAGFCLQNLYAQTITLSSEIVWGKKDVYLLDYDNVNVPFLRFKYKNNTADSIYFYNSLRNEGYFPEYLFFSYNPGFLINISVQTEWKTLMTSFPNWSDNEYVINIAKEDEFNYYGLSFLLYKKGETKINREAVEASDEHYILRVLMSLLKQQLMLDRDNTNLQFEYFHHPEKDSSLEKHLEYCKSLKLQTFEKQMEELSKKSVYDNCVFLNPSESFSFEYDLTPFFLLKGSYHFIIKPKMPKSVVLFENHVLPKVYKGYKLFTGHVKGVDILLNIPPDQK